MARDGEKNTIGQKIESMTQELGAFTGVGVGSPPAVYTATTVESLSPETVLLTAGSIASLIGGVYAGRKLSDRLEGNIAERIDSLKPGSMRSGELYLNSRDPFEILPDERDLNSLSREQREKVTQQTERDPTDAFSLAEYSQQEIESQQAEKWVEEIAFGEIDGLQGQYWSSYDFCGAFKTGYLDEANEVFVQAPTKGDTFQETLENVQSWKENKETLDQAEKYIDQVLEKTGTKVVSNGENLGQTEIDYDFLREKEEILRQEIEGGIMTPSENYDVVITSYEGQPLPILVGEYNPDMVEGENKIGEQKAQEVEQRKQVLGMYMDTLIEEQVFEGVPGDFWYQETVEDGRKQTKNMFYDPEQDRVGLTDIGEYRSGTKTPEDLPQVDVKQPYRLEKA